MWEDITGLILIEASALQRKHIDVVSYQQLFDPYDNRTSSKVMCIGLNKQMGK